MTMNHKLITLCVCVCVSDNNDPPPQIKSYTQEVQCDNL